MRYYIIPAYLEAVLMTLCAIQTKFFEPASEYDGSTDHPHLRHRAGQNRQLQTCPPSFIACTSRPLLKQASTYQASVVDLQCLLNQEIGSALVVDGYFGSLTNTAVRNWQDKECLSVDGIVGPITWASLCEPSSVTIRQDLTGDLLNTWSTV
mmetsp:Transcript_13196/g.18916  ORF Transcript_13196/g.18916 Transcript_13196/m.18916 type:complete len:152 (-) Transcript_13196:62-517(-)